MWHCGYRWRGGDLAAAKRGFFYFLSCLYFVLLLVLRSGTVLMTFFPSKYVYIVFFVVFDFHK